MKEEKTPKISIAMATYNGEKYLQEQLDSFTTQTRLPDELVVCDDCSSDSTVKILEDFARTAPFEVRIERNERNYGYIKNFERALIRCEGDIIFLSDQDDIWWHKKIDTQARYLINNSSCRSVSCDMLIQDPSQPELRITVYRNLVRGGFGLSDYRYGCSMAVTKDLLDISLPFPDNIAGHDTWIAGIAYELGWGAIIDEPLQTYRRHSYSVTKSSYYQDSDRSNIAALRRYGLKSVTHAWQKEILDTAEIRNRILKSIDGRRLKDDAKTHAIMNQLAGREAALKDRIRISQVPRISRWAHIIKAISQSKYDYFRGWKSALKDMIRPTH